MKQQNFWQLVDERVKENQQIVQGGLPNSWASVMSWVGLKFWVVGLGLSLLVSMGIWISNYSEFIRIVRVLIWR